MGGNSMANSSNKTGANPNPTNPVGDGMGRGGSSNGGSTTDPG